MKTEWWEAWVRKKDGTESLLCRKEEVHFGEFAYWTDWESEEAARAEIEGCRQRDPESGRTYWVARVVRTVVPPIEEIRRA